MSEEYNKEIEKAVQLVIQSPTLIGIMLKNYDQMVKEKSNMQNLELPYWCYGFCCAEPGNEKDFLDALSEQKLDTIEFSENTTNENNGGRLWKN